MLSRCLETAARLFPDIFDFWPKSWVLPEENELFYKAVDNAQTKTFIVKPDSGSQGDGIFLINSCRDFIAKVASRNTECIAQEYIANPLLLDGLKFDLRIYVLITSVSPFKIFMAKDGLARFCTDKYTAPSGGKLGACTQHLTNYSLNVRNNGFVHSTDDTGGENSSKRSMKSVFSALQRRGVDTDGVLERIRTLIAHTCLAVRPVLLDAIAACADSAAAATRCFHVVGFDVMLDAHLRPWLLEINRPAHRPSSTLQGRASKASVSCLFGCRGSHVGMQELSSLRWGWGGQPTESVNGDSPLRAARGHHARRRRRTGCPLRAPPRLHRASPRAALRGRGRAESVPVHGRGRLAARARAVRRGCVRKAGRGPRGHGRRGQSAQPAGRSRLRGRGVRSRL
jgi:hypothetical protein